jgi:hypothetical protein
VRSPAAEVSVVLATSAADVVRSPLDAYRRQSVADRVEVLLVAPPSVLAELADLTAPELHSLRPIAVSEPFDLARARAVGALAASAPWVFIGETHSFAEPTLIEHLLAASRDRGKGADGPSVHGFVPAIYNVNPSGAVSWASFLIDYGAWAPGHRGVVPQPPIYNALVARAELERPLEELTRAMMPYDESASPLDPRRGQRALAVPAARIGHLNVVRISDFALSKHWAGLAVGDLRRRRWRWPRRLAYAAAAPAVAVVLFGRYLAGWRIARRAGPLPFGVVPLFLLGAATRAVGETIGYLGLTPAVNDRRLERLEIRKVDLVAGWRP